MHIQGEISGDILTFYKINFISSRTLTTLLLCNYKIQQWFWKIRYSTCVYICIFGSNLCRYPIRVVQSTSKFVQIKSARTLMLIGRLWSNKDQIWLMFIGPPPTPSTLCFVPKQLLQNLTFPFSLFPTTSFSIK